MTRIMAADAHELISRALQRARTSVANANIVADALVAAELDGLPSHGLSRVAAYSEQAIAGKVDGQAEPAIDHEAAAALRVDARKGFAYPAIRYGLKEAVPKARASGVCLLAVAHSHHAGVLGYHAEAIAEVGLIGLGFTNTPAAMAPWGGHQGVFGTNPIAFAVPRENSLPMVIDLSLSTVARGKVMVANQRGEAIPEGWALDAAGGPTTNAEAALQGTMVPAGGAKGAALALMVEILTASLTGSSYAFEASSFFDADGPPPDISQSFLLIDPRHFAGAAFARRLEILLSAIDDQPGARVPGTRRLQLREQNRRDGLEVDDAVLADIRRRAA